MNRQNNRDDRITVMLSKLFKRISALIVILVLIIGGPMPTSTASATGN